MSARIHAMSVSGQQFVDDGRQAVAHLCAGGKPARLQRAWPLARAHQPGCASECRGRLKVAQRVAHCGYALQACVVTGSNVFEKPRCRFAAAAAVIGAVGANEDGVDEAAGVGQFTPHAGMDGVERIHGKQAARQPRLVGGHDHAPAGARQPRNGVEATRYGLPFLRRLDEGVAVFVDDAVAIEYGQLHCASLAMSATSFMLRCSVWSRARRLRRTSGSSAMTMTSLKKASTASRVPASVASDALKSPLRNCSRATGASS